MLQLQLLYRIRRGTNCKWSTWDLTYDDDGGDDDDDDDDNDDDDCLTELYLHIPLR